MTNIDIEINNTSNNVYVHGFSSDLTNKINIRRQKITDTETQIVDNKNTLTVCCGDGKCVDILEVQPEGKKRMDTKSFLLGNTVDISTILGN